MNSFDETKMSNMRAFYDSSIDHCLCSNYKLESDNYKTDIPCIHRLRLLLTCNLIFLIMIL